jgi:hypothetical protein
MSGHYIRKIEQKQLRLKSAIAADTRECLLSDDERTRLHKLETFHKIYSYQQQTAEDLLQVGRFMLKTYDTYIDILTEILKTLKDYYFRNNGAVNCSDVKKVVDVTVWFEKMKKLLIRFQAFTRGATFMQFRLIFKEFFEVQDLDGEVLESGKVFEEADYALHRKNIVKNASSNINNSFELWTDKFTSSNVNRTSVTSASYQEKECSGPSFFDPDSSTGASGIQISRSNPFYGMSYDDIDLFEGTQISALQQYSVDKLTLTNTDNTPYNVLCTFPLEAATKEDLIYFDCNVLQEYVDCFKADFFAFETGLDEIVKNMTLITETLYESANNNKSSTLTEFFYVEITQEYACNNVKFLQEEIEKIISVDSDDLVSMVENGNVLKEKIRKLPCIGSTSIFNQHERKCISTSSCSYGSCHKC